MVPLVDALTATGTTSDVHGWLRLTARTPGLAATYERYLWSAQRHGRHFLARLPLPQGPLPPPAGRRIVDVREPVVIDLRDAETAGTVEQQEQRDR